MKLPQIQWIDKDWYTYWGSADNPNKADQTFYILPIKSFTYKQLLDNLDDCMNQVQKITGKDDAAMQRLRYFVSLFMSTVNSNPNLIRVINGSGSAGEPNVT